jgi:hypothetical protein
VVDEILQNLYKPRSGGLQLLQMVQGKTLQEPFAVTGELDQNLAPIIGCAQTAKQTSVDEAVDELDGAVMLQLHSFGQHTDGWL